MKSWLNLSLKTQKTADHARDSLQFLVSIAGCFNPRLVSAQNLAARLFSDVCDSESIHAFHDPEPMQRTQRCCVFRIIMSRVPGRASDSSGLAVAPLVIANENITTPFQCPKEYFLRAAHGRLFPGFDRLVLLSSGRSPFLPPSLQKPMSRSSGTEDCDDLRGDSLWVWGRQKTRLARRDIRVRRHELNSP
jgi:hypothetical protein